MDNVSLISVVDDDESIRESLKGLLKALGFAVEVFSSAEAFLRSDAHPKTNCLILDVTLPGMSGLELQRELKERGARIPIIFITSHADHNIVSQMKADGAIDCLAKPFKHDSLLKAIRLSLSG
jgi:FixJ family two-component response regulator